MEKKELEIKNALAHIENLLRTQLERASATPTAKLDFGELDQIIIGVANGDGIGPIIMRETRRVLNRLLAEEVESGKILVKEIHGLTLENRIKTGEAVPKDVLAEIEKCHVLLKGPTTTPKGGSLESANVTLRRELDLYANVRPVSIPEEGLDWIFFRENTEGEYALGSQGIQFEDSLAIDFKVTSAHGTERIVRSAFEYARANGKKNLAIVTKANIMKKTDGLFSKIAWDVAKEYPEIKAEEWYVDIMAANLVNKEIRGNFEVFVLPNLYGDIITDEAAQIQGGVGTAGSVNMGDRYAMFEAIHGSAPRMVENGEEEFASPISLLKATEMMLRHIGMITKADRLSKAMEEVGKTRFANISPQSGIKGADYVDKLIECVNLV